MENKIYIVTGTTGKYEDRNTWNVAAFLDLDIANDFLIKCQECANRTYKILRKRNEDFDLVCWDEDKKNPELQNPFDPYMDFRHTMIEYEIDSVALVRSM